MGHEETITHDETTGEPSRERWIVSDDEERHLLFSVYLFEEPMNLLTGPLIEVSGRFIGEKEPWPIDECAREGDALLLATAQLTWSMGEALLETHPNEPLFSSLANLLPLASRDEPGDADILQRGQLLKEVMELKDKADLSVSKGSDLIVAQR